jgi:hypothetical protein
MIMNLLLQAIQKLHRIQIETQIPSYSQRTHGGCYYTSYRADEYPLQLQLKVSPWREIHSMQRHGEPLGHLDLAR